MWPKKKNGPWESGWIPLGEGHESSEGPLRTSWEFHVLLSRNFFEASGGHSAGEWLSPILSSEKDHSSVWTDPRATLRKVTAMTMANAQRWDNLVSSLTYDPFFLLLQPVFSVYSLGMLAEGHILSGLFFFCLFSLCSFGARTKELCRVVKCSTINMIPTLTFENSFNISNLLWDNTLAPCKDLSLVLV